MENKEEWLAKVEADSNQELARDIHERLVEAVDAVDGVAKALSAWSRINRVTGDRIPLKDLYGFRKYLDELLAEIEKAAFD